MTKMTKTTKTTNTLLTLIVLTIINLTLADTNSTDLGEPFKDTELWTLFGIGFACILAAVFILLLFEKCCKYWSGRRHIEDEEMEIDVFEK